MKEQIEHSEAEMMAGILVYGYMRGKFIPCSIVPDSDSVRVIEKTKSGILRFGSTINGHFMHDVVGWWPIPEEKPCE